MILVLASQHDEAARGFTERLSAGRAVVLTCQDLVTEGWRFYPDSPRESVAVAGGNKIRDGAISGVLTLRPCVLEQELTAVDPQDRHYVCAEINAFLIAWLSTLSCRVLNRPTATSLSGPNWRPERWIAEASRLGIPVEPRTRSVPLKFENEPKETPEEPVQHIPVVGGRARLGAQPELARFAERLARQAEVEWLETRFRRGRMIWAGCWPDLSRPEVADALLEFFA